MITTSVDSTPTPAIQQSEGSTALEMNAREAQTAIPSTVKMEFALRTQTQWSAITQKEANTAMIGTATPIKIVFPTTAPRICAKTTQSQGPAQTAPQGHIAISIRAQSTNNASLIIVQIPHAKIILLAAQIIFPANSVLDINAQSTLIAFLNFAISQLEYAPNNVTTIENTTNVTVPPAKTMMNVPVTTVIQILKNALNNAMNFKMDLNV